MVAATIRTKSSTVGTSHPAAAFAARYQTPGTAAPSRRYPPRQTPARSGQDAGNGYRSRSIGEVSPGTARARVRGAGSVSGGAAQDGCRVRVGREERLDRQLGHADVERGAEGGHGAEEGQLAVAVADAERHGDVARPGQLDPGLELVTGVD